MPQKRRVETIRKYNTTMSEETMARLEKYLYENQKTKCGVIQKAVEEYLDRNEKGEK